MALQFHNNFRVRSPSDAQRTLNSALAFAIGNREGTPEEVFLIHEPIQQKNFYEVKNFSS